MGNRFSPIDLALMMLVAVLLGLVLAASRADPLADFDFGGGLVRCGVAGFPPSCGSVAGR